MADTKQSGLTPRGTPSRAVDTIMIVNGSTNYVSTINNELGISGNPVGDSDSQTMTNKILTAPTITSPILSGTISGVYTLGGTPTFPSSIATLTGAQTLTNKILTSPILTAPTITNASITADAITGFTTANTGTIYGVQITGGTLGTTALATNAVQGSQLATNAITLGYAQVTTNGTTTSTSFTDITGLTVTVTIPAGGRRIKITVWSQQYSVNASTINTEVAILEDGVQLSETLTTGPTSGFAYFALPLASKVPTAGSHTYKAQWKNNGGGTATSTMTASATSPAFILVELI